MKRALLLTVAAAAISLTTALSIQSGRAADETADAPHQHMMQAMATPVAAPEDVYAGAMQKMHHDMAVTPTGDPDIDFVNGMIPHHQGAIDMAKIELEKGKDPEIRKLAEGIVAAQEKEIAFMKEWQARHVKQSISIEKK
jgi:uncharacterized protein (DUF305 family)